MKRLLLGIIIASLIVSVQGIKAVVPSNYDKLVSAVEKFVIAKKPEWKNEILKVNFKYVEDILASLSEDDNYDFSVSDAYQITKISPKMILPIEVVKDGQRVKTINILVQLEVYKKVLVAKKYIKKGKILEKDDFNIALRDIADLSRKYMEDTGPVLGKISRFSISEGRIILDYMVESLPDVKRGETIKVSVKLPNLKVETYGTALEDGQIGDNIKVRRNDSKKSFQALIVSSGEVEVLI